MDKKTVMKELRNVLFIVAASAISAVGLYYFVYPANFAPSGIDGIATMLQQLTDFSAGWYSIILNVPLLVVAWFILKKRYVIYTVTYTLLSALMVVVLQELKAPLIIEVSNIDRLIPAIFSGILLGVRTGIMLKIGASTGGIDIIACCIQKKRPHKNVESIITILCYVTIAISFFVYSDGFISVLLSVVQTFVFEKACAVLMQETRKAVEFKIITKDPDAIKQEIICELKHGATVIEGKGMYTGDGSAIIFSVVNTRQIPDFLRIIKKHPETFAYYGEVSGVNGNFRWFKDDAVK